MCGAHAHTHTDIISYIHFTTHNWIQLDVVKVGVKETPN